MIIFTLLTCVEFELAPLGTLRSTAQPVEFFERFISGDDSEIVHIKQGLKWKMRCSNGQDNFVLEQYFNTDSFLHIFFHHK